MHADTRTLERFVGQWCVQIEFSTNADTLLIHLNVRVVLGGFLRPTTL